jgi:hydrogenase expression/formation protein HypD
MKYVDEYRNPEAVQQYSKAIAELAQHTWTIMEICGGQTHTIVKYGLDTLLPPNIQLIHGPGCPVCVTPAEIIDTAISLAKLPEVILCSFGDMLRVPGSPNQGDLLSVKALGADVRILYSPLDALKIAQANPEKEVVFLAIGFETTVPATALTVIQAAQRNLSNFSLLVSHVLVPPAMDIILSSPNSRVQGFLAAGHVCTVMGCQEYEEISLKHSIPIVVTGFEPVDILRGLYHCIYQLETGQATVENQYPRSVRQQGNKIAQSVLQTVFEVVPQTWRGIGEIPASGLALKPEFARFDVRSKGLLPQGVTTTPPVANNSISDCISGLILQGVYKPQECSAFGKQCTPEHPLGSPMVSAEGACAAYYRYRQISVPV